MSIARPAVSLMRRPLMNDIKKHFVIAVAMSAAVALAWKHFVSDWRKEKYQTFYKTWDNDRHFKRMAAAGVFQSVNPESQPTPQWLVDYEQEVDKAIAAFQKK